MPDNDIFSRWTDIVSKVMAQVFSGRWLITVAAIYCLSLLAKTLCILMEQGKITLEASTYVAIVMSILNTVSTIVIFYFQKNRSVDNSNGNGDTNGDNGSATTTTTTVSK